MCCLVASTWYVCMWRAQKTELPNARIYNSHTNNNNKTHKKIWMKRVTEIVRLKAIIRKSRFAIYWEARFLFVSLTRICVGMYGCLCHSSLISCDFSFKDLWWWFNNIIKTYDMLLSTFWQRRNCELILIFGELILLLCACERSWCECVDVCWLDGR